MSDNIPIVLITGANKGIGLAISRHLSQSTLPYHILIGCRNITNGADAVTNLLPTKSNTGSTISALEIDITSHSSILSAADKIKTTYGRLDILIQNAAIAYGPNNDPTSPDDWRAVFETNLFGTVDATYTLLPMLQNSVFPNNQGKVVILSSSMSSLTLSSLPATKTHPLGAALVPYRASKAAVNMLIVCLTQFVEGVRVWGVDPGLCRTEMAGEYSLGKGRDPKEAAEIVRQCFEGEREDAVGRVVWEQGGETGVRDW